MPIDEKILDRYFARKLIELSRIDNSTEYMLTNIVEVDKMILEILEANGMDRCAEYFGNQINARAGRKVYEIES